MKKYSDDGVKLVFIIHKFPNYFSSHSCACLPFCSCFGDLQIILIRFTGSTVAMAISVAEKREGEGKRERESKKK